MFFTVSLSCRPTTVGEVSVDSRSGVDRHSNKSRPRVDRHVTNSRLISTQIVGRHINECSVDSASVKHQRNIGRILMKQRRKIADESLKYRESKLMKYDRCKSFEPSSQVISTSIMIIRVSVVLRWTVCTYTTCRSTSDQHSTLDIWASIGRVTADWQPTIGLVQVKWQQSIDKASVK